MSSMFALPITVHSYLHKLVRKIFFNCKSDPISSDLNLPRTSNHTWHEIKTTNLVLVSPTSLILKLLKAHSGQVLELKTAEEPSHGFCKFYLQELYQVPTVNMREKSSWISGRRRGKGAILEIHQSILFSLTRLALKRNYFIRTNQTGVQEIQNSSPL